MELQTITTAPVKVAPLRGSPALNALNEAREDYQSEAREAYEGVTDTGLNDDELALTRIGGLLAKLARAVVEEGPALNFPPPRYDATGASYPIRPSLSDLIEMLGDVIADELPGCGAVVRAQARMEAGL